MPPRPSVKQLRDYHIVNDLPSLSAYTGLQDRLRLADNATGPGVYKHTNSFSGTVDGIVVLPASGKGNGHWVLQDTPVLTAALLGGDPTTKLNQVFLNTPARTVELLDSVSNLGRVIIPDSKTLYLRQNVTLTARPLTTPEKNGVADYGIIELQGNGRVIGPGVLDGNKATITDAQCHGIFWANNAGEVNITGLKIKNCRGDSIKFQNVGRVDISSVRITGGNDRGVHGVISSDVQLTNITVNGGTHGIQWWGSTGQFCDNWTITGCQIYGVSGGGIWGYRGTGITVNGGSTIQCEDIGVDFEQCYNSAATGVFVRNCTNAGLGIYNGCRDISFTGCIVRQDNGYGPAFRIFSPNNGLTTKNTRISVIGGSLISPDNVQPILTDQDTAEDITISNADINGAYCQFMDANRVKFINNTLRTPAAVGVWNLGGKEAIITGNRLYFTGIGNVANEIRITYRSASYPATDCRVEGNRAFGFGGGIWDDGDTVGSPLSSSGNMFLRNETGAAVRQPVNKPFYSLVCAGNYKSDGTSVDGWDRQFITKRTGSAGYAPILTLPTTSAGSSDRAVMLVALGGFGGVSKKLYQLQVGQRDGLNVTNVCHGANSNPGSVVAYQQGDGTTTFYLNVGPFAEVGIKYQLLNQATGVQSIEFSAGVPSGTKIYDSATNPPNLEIDGNTLRAGGSRVHTDSLLPLPASMTPALLDNLSWNGTQWTNQPRWLADKSSTAGYTPILTLPASGAASYDQAVILVSLGAYAATNKKELLLRIGQRDGLTVHSTLTGNAAAPGKVVAYQNVDGSTTFYLNTATFNEFGVVYLRITQSTPVTTLVKQTTVPTGTLIWDSSAATPNLEVGSSYVKVLGNYVGIALQKAGAPSTAEIPDKSFGIVDNTSDGTVKLYYNKSGAFRSVTLV